MFWRHIVLGAFFLDDRAVQLRIAHYRGETVHKLIRQGQMSDGALVPQGRRLSSDIEYWLLQDLVCVDETANPRLFKGT